MNAQILHDPELLLHFSRQVYAFSIRLYKTPIRIPAAFCNNMQRLKSRNALRIEKIIDPDSDTSIHETVKFIGIISSTHSSIFFQNVNRPAVCTAVIYSSCQHRITYTQGLTFVIVPANQANLCPVQRCRNEPMVLSVKCDGLSRNIYGIN
jgi:hypothetical protein